MNAPFSPSANEGENSFSPYLINWHAQWAECGWRDCGPYFEIDLKQVIKGCPHKIRMLPGPGFGDLTHPTTVLTLKLLKSLIKGAHFIDMGCGSGILSFGALKFGAKSALGIDIDLGALKHAEENALINEVDSKVSFTLPKDFKPPKDNTLLVIAMNMIYSEQIKAWQNFALKDQKGLHCITSGILQEQRELYLKICHTFGWTLLQTKKQGKWLAFHFIT